MVISWNSYLSLLSDNNVKTFFCKFDGDLSIDVRIFSRIFLLFIVFDFIKNIKDW